MNKLITGSIAALMIMTFATATSGQRSNPLLVPSPAPFEAVPFDLLQSSDYEEAVMEGIRINKAEIKAITDQKEAPTFENTIVALDRAGKTLSYAVLSLSNIEHAVGDTVMMNILARVTPALSEHSASLTLNEPLFNRIKSVYDSRESRSDLTPEDMRLITETYKSFATAGAALKGEDREKYRKLNAELSNLNVKFSQNVTNGMKAPERRLWVTAADVEGMPASIVTAARAEAKEALEAEGKADDENAYLFTVYAPSYGPFMKYQKNRELRKKMYEIYSSRNCSGEFSNKATLIDIANVRLELANLLGFPTFADYQLQQTMAGNPGNVWDLLHNLRDSYTEPMKEELKEIEEFARVSEGPDFQLAAYDYSYWADKLKNKKFSISDEDLKPYFELNNTIKGVLGLATRLYGYTFKENTKIPVYHPDVKAYEVYGPDKKILGILYADFFYRPGKAPGAWMTEFRGESKDDAGKRTIPLISIVTNFSKPVGKDAVLLTPGEVETFLHEFGHALHGLSAESKYSTFAGTNVYHDFVELFSQFNENFLPHKEFLDTFAKHYKTGKGMPKELLEKFVESQQFGAAYACMRQLCFGYLDMTYHTITSPLRATQNLESFESNAIEPVKCFDAIEGTMISPAFGHIFSGGYAAGYYGYKWAELLDADAFAAFKENGIFDKKTASKFRKMLQSGGSVDPMELYIEFRGKRPTIDALLERDGIK